MENELEVNRREINNIDQEMKDLFIRRFACAKKIAIYKKQNNLPVFDERREEELKQRLIKEIDDESLKDLYLEFLEELLKLSKAYQKIVNEEK